MVGPLAWARRHADQARVASMGEPRPDPRRQAVRSVAQREVRHLCGVADLEGYRACPGRAGRRVIVTRPAPDTVEAKVVWVSGAVIPLRVHPPILRQSDVRGYEHFVERVLALGASGYQDHEMARCLTAEGVRSARRVLLPVALVGEVRPAGGHILLTEQFKTQAKLEGQGTVFGLPQDLVVPRNWLYGTAVSGDGG